MKTTKIIRYAGLGLVILSAMLLLYLYSYTFTKDKTASSPDQYAVLEITSGSSAFPQTDYDVLFSKLALRSDAVRIDTNDTVQNQQKRITDAMESMGSDHIILFAWEEASIPALSNALSNPAAASVILVSPSLSESDVMEVFGTHLPNIPVAIFDVNTIFSSSLYERLSGEDTTLFPGLKDEGKLSPTVFISPDGSRYLSQWDFIGQNKLSRSALTFLPQVQIKIGEFISTYVFDPALPDISSRSVVALEQTTKLLAVTFLATGLLLFFASIPKSGRRKEKNIRTIQTPLERKSKPEPDQIPDQIPDRMQDRSPTAVRRKAFLLFSLVCVLFTSALLLFYHFDLRFSQTVLAAWPVVYFAAAGVLFVKHFFASRVRMRIPARRLLFSGLLAILLLSGILLLMIMHAISPGDIFSGTRGILLFLLCLFLFAANWVQMSPESIPDRTAEGNSHNAQRLVWLQWGGFLFPYFTLMIYLLVNGKRLYFAQSTVLLAAVCLGLWLRFIFRRISGTTWMAAIVFAVFYTLTAFR